MKTQRLTGAWQRAARGDRTQVEQVGPFVYLSAIEAPTDLSTLVVLTPDEADALADRLKAEACCARVELA